MFQPIVRSISIACLAAFLGACGTTAPPPPPPPVYAGTIEDLYHALAQRESGGSAAIVNAYGYLGLYQMGEPAMMDAAWYDETPPNETSRNDWIGAWLTNAQANGVTSKATSLTKPFAQDIAVRRYHDRLAGYISALGLLAYEGKTVNGVVITRSGLLAACHLLGCGTVRDYLKSPGGGTPADAYGTTIEEYLSLFANYQTAF